MFLGKVYKQNKVIFGIFIIYILGLSYCLVSGTNSFPFFKYEMYSGKTNEAYYYKSFAYFLDGKEINLMELPKSKREFVLTTTRNYYKGNYGKKHKVDPQFDSDFKTWLNKYLKRELNLRGASLKVVLQKYHYTESNTFNLESGQNLFNYYKISGHE